MKSVVSYVGEVREELSRVVWPKRQEVIKLTSTVVIITAIVGVYVGVLDILFAQLITFLVTL